MVTSRQFVLISAGGIAALVLAELDLPASLMQQSEKPFRYIVVDEAQDLSPVQSRFLRAAVSVAANDIFLTGDTHQRIYSNRVMLRNTGIHVASRSSLLKVNYRTTAEILAWSLELLRCEPIDNMEGGPGADLGLPVGDPRRVPELQA